MSGAWPVLFGKLPKHGDFVARNLDAAGRAAWDDCLSRGLELAREALGERFTAAHEAGAPWRFVDGPGPLGEGWRAGAIAPSIDAGGRRFMIMLAMDGLSSDEAGGYGEAIAETMEELIYDAFERNWDADAIVAAAWSRLALDGGEAHRIPEARSWTRGGPASAARTVGGDLSTALCGMLTADPNEAGG